MLVQVSQEARVIRPQRHPAGGLSVLQELLQDPEQVARVVILVQREAVEP